MIRIIVRIGSRVLVDDVVDDENADIIVSIMRGGREPGRSQVDVSAVEARPVAVEERGSTPAPQHGPEERGFDELEKSVEEELEKINEAVSKHTAKKVINELLSDFEKQ